MGYFYGTLTQVYADLFYKPAICGKSQEAFTSNTLSAFFHFKTPVVTGYNNF